MAAVGHFGYPKFTLDHILAILDFWQNGCCRPFWMSEIRISGHFRSIWNFYFYKMAAGGHFGCLKIAFDCIYGHFRSIGHLDVWNSFQIHTDLNNVFFWQNGRRQPFWMCENHFRSHFWPFQIDTQLLFLFFLQKGRRRPFWIGRQCQLSNSSEILGWVMHVSSLKNVV